MKKYQTEFKLEVVKNFLAGEGGAKLLARDFPRCWSGYVEGTAMRSPWRALT